MSKDEAVRMAEDAELDLVCVSIEMFFTCETLAIWYMQCFLYDMSRKNDLELELMPECANDR